MAGLVSTIAYLVVLQKNETFEGNGYEIDIDGYSNWKGLFQIFRTGSSAPSSLDDAPTVRNVHIIGGETSNEGGFVVQAEQKHFIVESCSATGVIHGQGSPYWDGGGGICGQECAGDILITHCWSSGQIGYGAGGIAGKTIGRNAGGKVTITHCHSTGDIVESIGGGICGSRAGSSGGHVSMAHSYSTGKISGGGGICGRDAGIQGGHVSIAHSHSTGEITVLHLTVREYVVLVLAEAMAMSI